MTIFELAYYLTSDNKRFSQIKSNLDNVLRIIESIETISQNIIELPQRVINSSKKWANFGWVPSLPQDTGFDVLNAVNVPSTEKEADDYMISKVNIENGILFNEIEKNVIHYNHNIITFNDAKACFNNGLYTACALSIFALIDSCFLYGQPITTNNNCRQLARRAVKNVCDEDTSKFIVTAHTVKIIIENLYIHGKDFSRDIEKGLKRNFISHGMNLYNPNRIDCIKLFVLLYNVYLMFNSKIYNWDNVD